MSAVARILSAPRLFVCVLVWSLLACGGTWAAPAFPALSGRVVDEAQILSPATRDQLAALSEELEKKTGSQLVVATLKSLQGYTIEDYGYQLGRTWGIGQKGKNTGAILIVAPNERKVRIEVGYDLEDRLTDAATRGIIESVILPAFRGNNFDAGVRDGANSLARLIAGEAVAPRPRDEGGEPQDSGFPIEFILIVLFFLFMGGRGFLWPLLFLGGGSGRGGFRGGGFGRSSGGFSGGGGSFGGGGASGSW